jgi:cytochrome P450
MIIEEVLRLYPPVTILMRRATQDDEVGGYSIQKNSFVLWSGYVLHRHPDIWDEPEQFRPERWLPEQVEGRPRFSCLPFGGGPRICLGINFALMEMTLVLATLAQRYRTELLPGQVIRPKPLLSLRPNKEILIHLRPRS